MVAISWTEALPTRQPAAASTSADVLEDARRRAAPAQRRVVGAEQPADVAEPGGGEHGVGERVRDDVAVGVAGAAVDVRPVQAGDRSRPAGLDRVDVGADRRPAARSVASGPEPPTCASASARSCATVTLAARSSPSTVVHRDAGGADDRGVVGELDASAGEPA